MIQHPISSSVVLVCILLVLVALIVYLLRQPVPPQRMGGRIIKKAPAPIQSHTDASCRVKPFPSDSDKTRGERRSSPLPRQNSTPLRSPTPAHSTRPPSENVPRQHSPVTPTTIKVAKRHSSTRCPSSPQDSFSNVERRGAGVRATTAARDAYNPVLRKWESQQENKRTTSPKPRQPATRQRIASRQVEDIAPDADDSTRVSHGCGPHCMELPTATIEERIKRLQQKDEERLHALHMEALAEQGIARRPDTLIRTKHGPIKALAYNGASTASAPAITAGPNAQKNLSSTSQGRLAVKASPVRPSSGVGGGSGARQSSSSPLCAAAPAPPKRSSVSGAGIMKIDRD